MASSVLTERKSKEKEKHSFPNQLKTQIDRPKIQETDRVQKKKKKKVLQSEKFLIQGRQMQRKNVRKYGEEQFGQF